MFDAFVGTPITCGAYPPSSSMRGPSLPVIDRHFNRADLIVARSAGRVNRRSSWQRLLGTLVVVLWRGRWRERARRHTRASTVIGCEARRSSNSRPGSGCVSARYRPADGATLPRSQRRLPLISMTGSDCAELLQWVGFATVADRPGAVRCGSFVIRTLKRTLTAGMAA